MVHIWLCMRSWEISTLRDTWIETETFIMVLFSFFFLHANVKASGCGVTGRPSALALWIAPTVNVSYFRSKQKAESKVCRQKSFHFQRERWLQLSEISGIVLVSMTIKRKGVGRPAPPRRRGSRWSPPASARIGSIRRFAGLRFAVERREKHCVICERFVKSVTVDQQAILRANWPLANNPSSHSSTLSAFIPSREWQRPSVAPEGPCC